MNEILNKSIKYLPIGSTMMILLGILYSITFYECFGIDILNYIEFTEAILMVVENLEILLIFALSLIFTDVLERHLFPEKINSDVKKVERKDLVTSLVYPFMFLTGVFYLTTVVFSLFESKLLPIFLHYLYYFFAHLIVLLGVFIIWRSSYLKKTLIIYLSITLFFYTFYMAKSNAYLVFSKNESHTVSVKIKKETNNLTNNMRFIGKTKNYTFLYNMEKEESLIYPNDIIDHYKISK